MVTSKIRTGTAGTRGQTARRTLVAGVAVAALSLLAACGSTSNVGGTTTSAPAGTTTSSGSGATTAAGPAVGFGQQICADATGQKAGFTNGVSEIAGGANTLSGAGSTFVNPIMSIWAKDYSEKAGVQVAYQSVGSGAGVQQITAQTVDFGASDTPLKDSEQAAAPAPILHIPLTLGAVVPAYNIKGIPSGLKFDGPTLGKIFAGQITSWDDPALVALNPGADLPKEAIAVAHRSDGSGTTAVWTDYLTQTSPEWVTALGGADKSFGKEVAWPVGIGGKGNEGVSGVVGQTDGGIGYVELAYAKAQNLTYGQVQNKAGNFIEPCVQTISKGTDGIQYPADLRTSLVNGPDANAYPITATTFALVYQDQTDAAKGAALVNFLSWVLTTGQDDAAQIDYAPLGTDLQGLAIGQLKKMTVAGKPVS